ncbi:type II toxin-antitoxin system VapC family toxin [Arcobacter vandammei]|uniref:type II toxin-antitoxin system VapC family toxin n=1 Tax=Arcobacter vandammei TaxID=2782243 RepID=UPI0018DF1F01|nr:type II toxin-antitoxin system VapC family toxin [Arcobacter vandammei]
MQNKYFIDVNVLIDFLHKPDYTRVRGLDNDTTKDTVQNSKNYITELLKDENNICLLTSSTLVTIFFSMTNKEKHLRSETAELMLNFYNDKDMWQILEEKENTVIKALEFCKINNADYEDVLQYFSALENDCKAIITNDENFPKLDIPLIRTNPKLENYTPENKTENTQEKKGVIDNIINFVRKNK